MHRRTFLTAFAAAIPTGLTGCSALAPPPTTTPDGPNPDSSSDAPATQTPTPTQYERFFRSFRSQLTEREVRIRELSPEEDGSIVSLEYITTQTNYQEIGGEVGMIAGRFFRLVGEGWDVDRLDAVILQDEDSPYGTWHAEAAWYSEFESGEITGEQLSIRVLDTLERA
jgi:hypothetical protein